MTIKSQNCSDSLYRIRDLVSWDGMVSLVSDTRRGFWDGGMGGRDVDLRGILFGMRSLRVGRG